jgi:hypothetical protein
MGAGADAMNVGKPRTGSNANVGRDSLARTPRRSALDDNANEKRVHIMADQQSPNREPRRPWWQWATVFYGFEDKSSKRNRRDWDREPQPSDGPDYWDEHAAWEVRQTEPVINE